LHFKGFDALSFGNNSTRFGPNQNRPVALTCVLSVHVCAALSHETEIFHGKYLTGCTKVNRSLLSSNPFGYANVSKFPCAAMVS
jgi:hypothetical protein